MAFVISSAVPDFICDKIYTILSMRTNDHLYLFRVHEKVALCTTVGAQVLLPQPELVMSWAGQTFPGFGRHDKTEKLSVYSCGIAYHFTVSAAPCNAAETIAHVYNWADAGMESATIRAYLVHCVWRTNCCCSCQRVL